MKKRKVRFSKKPQIRVFYTTPKESFDRGYFIRCIDLRELKKTYTTQKHTIQNLQSQMTPFQNLCNRMKQDSSFKKFVESDPYQRSKFHQLFEHFQKINTMCDRFLLQKSDTKQKIKSIEKDFRRFNT